MAPLKKILLAIAADTTELSVNTTTPNERSFSKKTEAPCSRGGVRSEQQVKVRDLPQKPAPHDHPVRPETSKIERLQGDKSVVVAPTSEKPVLGEGKRPCASPCSEVFDKAA